MLTGYKVGGTTCNVGKVEELQKFIEEGLIAFGSDVVHGVVLNAAGKICRIYACLAFRLTVM